MALPFFAAPVIYGVITGAGLAYLYKNTEGELVEIGKDVADQAVNEGAELVQGTLEELAPILQDFGSAIAQGLGTLGNQTLDVIRGAIPAVIDGIDDGYDYIRNKIRGNEPTIIASITVGMLTILTGVYLVNAARRGTMTYKP